MSSTPGPSAVPSPPPAGRHGEDTPVTALPAVTAEAAQRFGERSAYVTPEGWGLSYRALHEISDEVAAGLARRGIGRGDVVALRLPPGAEFLVSYVAAAKVGAITTGINDRLAEGEQRAILERAQPSLVLGTDDAVAADAETLVLDGPAPDATALLRALRVDGPPPPPPEDHPDLPVAIIFTSGTTGVPKGAVYCRRQMDFITRTDVGDAWDGGGRSLTGTSFAHLGFMTKLAGNLRRGTTNFIMRRWHARPCLELLAREHMSTVAGVPTQIALMLRQPDFDSFDLSSIQYIVVGGGPLTPGLAVEARQRFGALLSTRYSCTEAGIGLGTAFTDPEEDAVVSVGRPLPGVELSLRDPGSDGAAVEVAPGAVGEVCLRSPACMRGYWNDEVATAAAFTTDGFVRTGDLGWIDERGRVHLVGRAKEMYVRGGYNVYPVEVEAVLSDHPAIAAVAVAPRPDDVMGEVGVACVVVRPGAPTPTVAALRAHCDGRLAAYKQPDDVVAVEALPLTAGEKVDRTALARLVARP